MTSINNDDNVNTDNNTVKTDILIPVYLDKTPILWDGNDAHIEGLLFDVGRYYKRTGLFQTFLEHHHAPLEDRHR